MKEGVRHRAQGSGLKDKGARFEEKKRLEVRGSRFEAKRQRSEGFASSEAVLKRYRSSNHEIGSMIFNAAALEPSAP